MLELREGSKGIGKNQCKQMLYDKTNQMDHVYMLIYGSDWDDTQIILSTEDAIKASIKHPQSRVE
jgi:hypothetical protein